MKLRAWQGICTLFRVLQEANGISKAWRGSSTLISVLNGYFGFPRVKPGLEGIKSGSRATSRGPVAGRGQGWGDGEDCLPGEQGSVLSGGPSPSELAILSASPLLVSLETGKTRKTLCLKSQPRLLLAGGPGSGGAALSQVPLGSPSAAPPPWSSGDSAKQRGASRPLSRLGPERPLGSLGACPTWFTCVQPKHGHTSHKLSLAY